MFISGCFVNHVYLPNTIQRLTHCIIVWLFKLGALIFLCAIQTYTTSRYTKLQRNKKLKEITTIKQHWCRKFKWSAQEETLWKSWGKVREKLTNKRSIGKIHGKCMETLIKGWGKSRKMYRDSIDILINSEKFSKKAW